MIFFSLINGVRKGRNLESEHTHTHMKWRAQLPFENLKKTKQVVCVCVLFAKEGTSCYTRLHVLHMQVRTSNHKTKGRRKSISTHV